MGVGFVSDIDAMGVGFGMGVGCGREDRGWVWWWWSEVGWLASHKSDKLLHLKENKK